MSERTKISYGVLPYDDGSGDRFTITLAPSGEGTQDELTIAGPGDHSLYMTVREWVYLRKAIDDGVTAFLGLQKRLHETPEKDSN